jgi:hypothetical protein
LVAGRFPTAEEIRSEADVVVLSRKSAASTFGDVARAVGKRLRIKSLGEPTRSVMVVGVVPDIGGNGLYNFTAPIYSVVPLRTERAGGVVVRVSGDPQTHVKDLRRVLARFDQSLTATGVHTAGEIVDRTLGATRGRAIFLSAVATLALLLAVIGLYGLTSYTTELRARDLGIRIALGGRPWDVASVVLADLWWMAGIGILAGALATSRLVAFLDALYRNPMLTVPLIRVPVVPMIASAIALALIMILGTAIPLRRVLRIDVVRTITSG